MVDMKKPSILIVDSNPKNFEFLEMLLEKDGYQLHYSSSGLVAMSSLELFKPDLILLDILLPSMDGVDSPLRTVEVVILGRKFR